MHIIGIVAEYNPFHTGHAHHINEIKKIYPDALIVVAMSGSFVQRGEPALFDKFLRSQWALMSGAHAVVELPTIFATSNAERFATGAVRLLAGLGVTTLSFGAETSDIDLLWQLSKISQSAAVQSQCQAYLKEGYSYGTSLRKAIQHADANLALNGDDLERVLTGPNNILALEYVKAIQTHRLPLQILPIARQSDHHSSSLSQHFPSGTALRQAISELSITTTNAIAATRNMNFNTPENIETSDLKKSLPSELEIAELMSNFPVATQASVQEALQHQRYVNYDYYMNLVHYQSRLKSAFDLKNYPDFTEGLESLWSKASAAPSWPSALEEIKSKRYTFSRLQRMGAYTVLNISKSLQDSAHRLGPTYARLLGFTNKARPWLKSRATATDLMGAIPLIQKWAPFVQDVQNVSNSSEAHQSQTSQLTRQLLELDMRATDIQALCMNTPEHRQGHRDYYMSPLYVKETSKF